MYDPFLMRQSMARILSALLAASESEAAEAEFAAAVWISTSLPSCDHRLLGTSGAAGAGAAKEDISEEGIKIPISSS